MTQPARAQPPARRTQPASSLLPQPPSDPRTRFAAPRIKLTHPQMAYQTLAIASATYNAFAGQYNVMAHNREPERGFFLTFVAQVLQTLRNASRADIPSSPVTQTKNFAASSRTLI
ncbi:uncharacterized protein BDZ99DRAFT_118732 [Mytilinidion resinicola]|uniref:Uncharacterized protein n=1 Tax=Mytilinidion resinicola TaxID=574789 RepID=A0A6A6Z3I4_9PEZI|nr:uncharacterized protein BDZ99DRAFT_118732 [Mytilinidion resinicola]KAF2815580.1 hypothetical protein BDZ99DRAFT_118732 [Mytilinidion resinicola]